MELLLPGAWQGLGSDLVAEAERQDETIRHGAKPEAIKTCLREMSVDPEEL